MPAVKEFQGRGSRYRREPRLAILEQPLPKREKVPAGGIHCGGGAMIRSYLIDNRHVTGAMLNGPSESEHPRIRPRIKAVCT
jgi:hypothetical protein